MMCSCQDVKETMVTAGVIISRSDSARLPNKVFKKVHGDICLLEMVVKRAKKTTSLDHIIVATTDRDCDSELADFAENQLGVKVYRGDLDDVAMRVLKSAQSVGADYLVRINGDSPFLSPTLIDVGIQLVDEKQPDLVSNLIERSYPYGVAVEVIKTQTLEHVIDSLSREQREHVTKYFYANQGQFQIKSLEPHPVDLSSVRLTIDNEQDLENVRKILIEAGGDLTVDYLQAAEIAQRIAIPGDDPLNS